MYFDGISRSLPTGGRRSEVYFNCISILNAANRETDRSAVGEHEGIAEIEVEEADIRAANCITPIEAACTVIDERTAKASVACRGQFKRRCKSTNACVSTPT